MNAKEAKEALAAMIDRAVPKYAQNASGDEVESAKVWDYINAMLIKNLKMRRALLRQWAEVHQVRCAFEDYYTGHVCSWPLPPCVGDATEAEIQEAARER